MNRAALRSDARKKRDAAASSELADVYGPPELMQILTQRTCVAGYWPVGSEVSPVPLLRTIASARISVCLPYFADRNAAMQFRSWNPETALEKSPFGFAQPVPDSPELEPDCLLVPLLAFDRHGNRVGQGGGHYDRYFSLFSNGLRIGMAWWHQERLDIVGQSWDVPMHFIATDREWIECSQPIKGSH